MSTDTVNPPVPTALQRPSVGQALRDSAYVLLGWPLLLGGFVVAVVLLAVGGSLLALAVGWPVFLAGLAASRWLARTERSRQRSLLGRELPEPLPERRPEGTVWSRAVDTLRDPQRFADAAFALGGWSVATVTWSLALVWWVAMLAGLTAPVWQRYADGQGRGVDLADVLHLGGGVVTHAVVNLLLGLVLAATLPWAMRALATAQSAWTSWLLVAPTRVARQRREHEQRMSDARDAELSSLQRLERDIHDGPQQRLVRLQLDLARATRQIDRDPERARGIVDGALEQARGALDELRAATRGIAPPIIVDRGLTAALDELAGRSALPARLVSDLPRINVGYETALYFAASEALTNAAKHSGAASATVRCFADGPWAVVEVEDDGRGGASIGGGSGLLGLERRLAALGGRLAVSSPVGGPTVVRAEVPCVS